MKSKNQRGFKDNLKKSKGSIPFQIRFALLLQNNKILKLFRAIKLIFTKNKPMKAIDNQKSLEKFVLHNLSEFHTYCTGQVSPWPNVKIEEAIKLTKPNDSINTEPIEFTCLGWDFILRKELYPFDGIGYFRTYEIILDNNNYPNKKLLHISNLDIVFGLKPNAPGNFKFQEALDSGITEVTNFSAQYLLKLYQVLGKNYTLES